MTVGEPTLILFDIDGTLLTTGGVGKAAFEQALCVQFGDRVDAAHINFAGKTDWEILQALLRPLGYSDAAIAEQMARFVGVLHDQMQTLIEAYAVAALPGTLALIERLAADPRARLGLVTGNAGLTAPLKLREAGFDPACFPVGAFGHESALRADLPPLAVARAARHWQTAFAPHRIVIVGDTPNDIICARSVNGRAVGVLTGHVGRAALAAEDPYAILDDLTDHDQVAAVLFGES